MPRFAARAVTLIVLLLTAAGSALAATASEFYLSLLRRGIASYEAGRFEDAARELDVAAFGLLESIDHFETAKVYAALANDKLGRPVDARTAAQRVVAAERVQRRFAQIAFPAEVRGAFVALAKRVLSGPEANALSGSGPIPAPALAQPRVTQTPATTTRPPATSTQAPAPTTTPAAPAPQKAEAAPAPQKSEPVPQKSEPAPQKTEPSPQKTQPAPQKIEPVPQKSEPAPQKTESAPQKTQPAPQKTEPVPQKTEPAPQKMEPAPQRPVPAPQKAPAVAAETPKPQPQPNRPEPRASKPAEPPKVIAERTVPFPSQAKAETPAPKPQTSQSARPVQTELGLRLASAERHLAANNLVDARVIYRQLIETSLDRASLLQVAEGSYRARDFATTIRAIDRAGALNRGEEPYRFYLAVALYETGAYERAKRELAVALPYIEITETVTRYRAKIEGAID